MNVVLRGKEDDYEHVDLGSIVLADLPGLVDAMIGSGVYYGDASRRIVGWQLTTDYSGEPEVQFMAGDEL